MGNYRRETIKELEVIKRWSMTLARIERKERDRYNPDKYPNLRGVCNDTMIGAVRDAREANWEIVRRRRRNTEARGCRHELPRNEVSMTAHQS